MTFLILTRVNIGEDRGVVSYVYHVYSIDAESKDDAMLKAEKSMQFDDNEQFIGVSQMPDDANLHYHFSGSASSIAIHPERGDEADGEDERKD
jgi:hypothetical protein